MKDEIEVTILYDIYGELLTARQNEILKMSLYYDNSLSEIADELQISRQTVKDSIDSGIEQLKKYDSVLHLREKKENLSNLVNRLKVISNDENTQDLIEKISEIIEDI